MAEIMSASAINNKCVTTERTIYPEGNDYNDQEMTLESVCVYIGSAILTETALFWVMHI